MKHNFSSYSTHKARKMSVLLNVVPDIFTECHLRDTKISPRNEKSFVGIDLSLVHTKDATCCSVFVLV